MRKSLIYFSIALAFSLLAYDRTTAAQGIPGKPSLKMYCWKNKAGKTECGDKVPYEYQEASITEINRQGVVTNRTEAVNPADRKAREDALLKAKLEEQKRAEQLRQDRMLLDTFSNEKEIQMKRARDVELINAMTETLQNNLKNINDREAYARQRADEYVKSQRQIPPSVLDDIQKAINDRAQTAQLIDQKRKELVQLNERYDIIRKRYAELTSVTAKKNDADQAAH